MYTHFFSYYEIFLFSYIVNKRQMRLDFVINDSDKVLFLVTRASHFVLILETQKSSSRYFIQYFQTIH